LLIVEAGRKDQCYRDGNNGKSQQRQQNFPAEIQR